MAIPVVRGINTKTPAGSEQRSQSRNIDCQMEIVDDLAVW